MNKIYTGNYKNFSNTDYNLISISGDRGAKENYQGLYIRELAPKRVFWDVWFNNIGKISKEDNIRFYIREYCKTVLSKIDWKEFINLFNNYDYPTILLCYEKSDEFCHRHPLAEYIKLYTDIDIEIPEGIIVNGNIKPIEHPKYVEDILKEEILLNKVKPEPIIKPKIMSIYRKR